MTKLNLKRLRRISWALATFGLVFCCAVFSMWMTNGGQMQPFSITRIVTQLFVLPALVSSLVFSFTSATAASDATEKNAITAADLAESVKPFVAQVVGLKWLNPLQRKDYSTEWQILWTLGMVKANKNDDMVRTEPNLFSKVKSIGIIATKSVSNGVPSLSGFHSKYMREMLVPYHDRYFSDSKYFYNAHNRDRSGWRELAGIHVEYSLPAGKLNPEEAKVFTREFITEEFDIGNVHFPTLWSRSTPPDVHVTMGGPNAGFTSLAAALDYLKANPTETVWVMSWDAPSYPEVGKINENMVQLILAGPAYNTERAPLAWIGYPATKNVSDFAPAKKGEPPRAIQAWSATMEQAAANANKHDSDIGYVIHDANNTNPASSDRIGRLAQTLTAEIPELDFMKNTFNTPALLGEMGAATALTNVALAIGYANHIGKNVLVAGTTEADHPTAVMVVPPAKVRPIDPDKDWFRARGGNSVFLPWWGLRHDAPPRPQGYSD